MLPGEFIVIAIATLGAFLVTVVAPLTNFCGSMVNPNLFAVFQLIGMVLCLIAGYWLCEAKGLDRKWMFMCFLGLVGVVIVWRRPDGIRRSS